jgi:dihydroorotate dehydrogenase (NAD+) catalytic subunit
MDAPASRNSRASRPVRTPPQPMIGTSGSASLTAHTQRTAIGRIAGPDSPPESPARAGRNVTGSIAIPGSVLIMERPSARYDIPVFAKLSPEVTDIVAIARACVAAGADGLSMINTLPGMAIDPVTFRPALAGLSGGLSGPAIRPIAVRSVWMVREALPDVPIIGCGGVRTGRDALEFLLAGASMVAVGTVLFHDPSACSRIQRELEEELAARGVDRVSDVIGRAHKTAVYATERRSWM